MTAVSILGNVILTKARIWRTCTFRRWRLWRQDIICILFFVLFILSCLVAKCTKRQPF